jgi:hypothetical protein
MTPRFRNGLTQHQTKSDTESAIDWPGPEGTLIVELAARSCFQGVIGRQGPEFFEEEFE